MRDEQQRRALPRLSAGGDRDAAPVAESRCPCGRRETRAGRRAMARAMATRCCSPPESSRDRVGAIRQADVPSSAAARASAARSAAQLEGNGDVLERAQRRDQVVGLKHIPEFRRRKRRARTHRARSRPSSTTMNPRWACRGGDEASSVDLPLPTARDGDHLAPRHTKRPDSRIALPSATGQSHVRSRTWRIITAILPRRCEHPLPPPSRCSFASCARVARAGTPTGHRRPRRSLTAGLGVAVARPSRAVAGEASQEGFATACERRR